jgi:hypothetical protein
MIVVAFFPKTPVVLLLKRVSGTQLENTDEFLEIGTSAGTLRKKMKMIGHDAIRVDEKILFGGDRQEQIANRGGRARNGQVGSPEVTADGHEVGAWTEVVDRRKANGFSIIRHGIYLDCNLENCVVASL